MNRPSSREIKALRSRYSPPKPKPLYWVVIDCKVDVFNHTSPAICQAFIDNNGLINAKKKPVYATKN